MDANDTRVYFDFTDPRSYLLEDWIESIRAETGLDVSWIGLELRPPPSPVLATDAPEWHDRWEDARRMDSGGRLPTNPPPFAPWTRKAHELTLHAAEAHPDAPIRRAILSSFFEEGADIGRVDVLVEIARGLGFDSTNTKAVLDVDKYEADVAARAAEARDLGVTETPTIVYGSKQLTAFHDEEIVRTFLGT